VLLFRSYQLVVLHYVVALKKMVMKKKGTSICFLFG